MIGWIFVYSVVAVFFGLFVAIWLDDRHRLPVNQLVAGGVIAALITPINLLILIGIGLYKGVPWVVCGFSGLYRTFFPLKVKLPKARIHDVQR